MDFIFQILACVIICFLIIKLINPIREIIKNFSFLMDLAKSDLKVKYAGSYLGIIWAYAQPILTTFIYWFVFQIGFKTAPIENFPFILWLITGLIPWFFFSDAIMNATSCMIEYSYLVKKVVFNIELLPLIKIIGACFIHSVFVIFIIVLYLVYGIQLDLYVLQAFYYSFCMILLTLGISYITATLNVFIKDVAQVVGIIIQFWFWMTPIVWEMNVMPEAIQPFLKINPMFYVVNGYRDAFINKIWFWENMDKTIFFWLTTCFILWIGITLFKKFRSQFADVL